MAAEFIGVGENIHCTRIYKVGGKFVKEVDGSFGIAYEKAGEARSLPVPPKFQELADWEAGKVKHCAVAIWQGVYGDDAGKEAGVDYIQHTAKKQESAGATYLDINVDEFSTDVEERVKLMEWTVGVTQGASSLPVCIDSSDTEILRAGLAATDKSRGAPMLNSVSLERPDTVAIAAEFGAVVIASAAGEKDLPHTTEGRLANLDQLVSMLNAAGIGNCAVHVDPLVFPISTDQTNGTSFLDAVKSVREKYGPEIHIVAGLSNISFGMPNRKLLNQVFAHLSVEAGGDGGIVDPLQINADILAGLDSGSEGYVLAKAVLVGEDDFGMNYITAAREGKI